MLQVPIPVTAEWLEEQYKAGVLIPTKSLADQTFYEGSCRNATVAMWDAPRRRFIHVRHKWGEGFLEAIRDVESGKNHSFDVFCAYKVLSRNDSKTTELQRYLSKVEDLGTI